MQMSVLTDLLTGYSSWMNAQVHKKGRAAYLTERPNCDQGRLAQYRAYNLLNQAGLLVYTVKISLIVVIAVGRV